MVDPIVKTKNAHFLATLFLPSLSALALALSLPTVVAIVSPPSETEAGSAGTQLAEG
jgi:hypothetical protein